MIEPSYRPIDDADALRCMRDARWRICSGTIYKIMIKSDAGDGQVVPFLPNDAQISLLDNLWYRNLVLKARQRGFTTMIAIMWLDHALFNADQRCGIIAQDQEAMAVIFRDKVKLAYDNMPDALRSAMPLARDSAAELLFGHNNSSVRVATSMRSGTIHRLHISEFGKICAKFPDKASEVITGSLPAVPMDGIVIMESTAEGRDGDFYAMSQRAKALQDSAAKLTVRDYRFMFVPWWDDPTYRLHGDAMRITDEDAEYFDGIEALLSITIDAQQRAWYVATRDSDFNGSHEKMWQEYPSHADEAFKVSTEGSYYSVQLTQARKDGRITVVPHVSGVPVNTFWDIGNSDGTAIWLHQRVGLTNRFIGFVEGWGEPYSYFGRALQATGYLWGTHYLPHDAMHKRQQHDVVSAPIDELRKLNIGGAWEIVPRVGELSHGIQLMRDVFSQCWFDERSCDAGIKHIEGYRKSWNERLGAWSSIPVKNIHTESADAIRQFAQQHGRMIAKSEMGPIRRRIVANVF